ncbi:hypothetical protein A0E43_08470 [Pectobacterium cacticida]
MDGRLQPTQTREYRYDGAGNLIGTRRNREAAGYKLDASGRVLAVLSGGAGRTINTEEEYRYTRSGLPQAATRLTDWQAGRLTQQDNTHYQYDKAGRLIRKQVVQPGYRPQVWHYRWDSRNQLRVVDTPNGERWFYRYDPFGRRIGKRCDQKADDIRYLWGGDQIAEVRHYRDKQLISRRHWVHNGWELLVQQRERATASWETDFVTSGHNGEPQAIFTPQGELRWLAPRTTLWGQRYTDKTENLDPGLAFAGQYRDEESRLCYNRFRYYDPSGGCYISPDPIGIAGGDNLYAYAPNPLNWVDPLGLSKCSLGKETGRYSAIKPSPLDRDLAETFSGGKYREIILAQDTSFFRAGVSTNPFGRFFSLDRPQSIIQTRVDKAVLPKWPNGSASPLDSVYEIKIPAGTKVYVGQVGYQNGFYLGGTEQIVILEPWNVGTVIGKWPLL